MPSDLDPATTDSVASILASTPKGNRTTTGVPTPQKLLWTSHVRAIFGEPLFRGTAGLWFPVYPRTGMLLLASDAACILSVYVDDFELVGKTD